jgi:hypothetical protein
MLTASSRCGGTEPEAGSRFSSIMPPGTRLESAVKAWTSGTQITEVRVSAPGEETSTRKIDFRPENSSFNFFTSNKEAVGDMPPICRTLALKVSGISSRRAIRALRSFRMVASSLPEHEARTSKAKTNKAAWAKRCVFIPEYLP